jgi:chaperonin GroES
MASKLNIKPLHNNVLIRPVAAETKTESGIILPDTVKEKPQIGEVLAVGEGWHNDQGKVFPLTIKKGQKVMYKKWGGNDFKHNNEELVLVEEKDILAIIE